METFTLLVNQRVEEEEVTKPRKVKLGVESWGVCLLQPDGGAAAASSSVLSVLLLLLLWSTAAPADGAAEHKDKELTKCKCFVFVLTSIFQVK